MLWFYCSFRLVVMVCFKLLWFIEWMLLCLQMFRVNMFIELLVFLLEEQEEVLEQVVCQVSCYVDFIEECFLSNYVQCNWVDLVWLWWMFLCFQWLLVLELVVMFWLFNWLLVWMDCVVVQVFCQFIEEFSVVFNDLLGLIECISLLQEEIGVCQLEQSNCIFYILMVIIVFVLLINIVVGFFGMNVGGILLVSNYYGFILLVVIVVVFIFGVGYLVFCWCDDLQIVC